MRRSYIDFDIGITGSRGVAFVAVFSYPLLLRSSVFESSILSISEVGVNNKNLL